ncbi:hypothetical protein M3Y98_00142600 [Aphelenchoides besseyi]|nr:hypothetical protein M3Y98_00142600 [Aphelenchoides besseyi]
MSQKLPPLQSQLGIETAKVVVSNNRWLNCNSICGDSDPHRVVSILYGKSKYTETSQTAKCFKRPKELPFAQNKWSPCVKNTKYRIRHIPRNFSLIRFDASDITKQQGAERYVNIPIDVCEESNDSTTIEEDSSDFEESDDDLQEDKNAESLALRTAAIINQLKSKTAAAAANRTNKSNTEADKPKHNSNPFEVDHSAGCRGVKETKQTAPECQLNNKRCKRCGVPMAK